MQSFFAAAGFKASWMWIVMLCHQMYYYVSTGGFFGLRRHHMHILVWCLSIGSTLLPLVQTSYGRDDDSGWCFLTDGHKDSTTTAVWSSVTFNVVLLCALVIMTYYNVMLYVQYAEVRDLKVISVFRSLYLYPLGMMCIWLPNLVVSALLNWGALTYSEQSSVGMSVFVDCVFIAATQNGTITAIIFFTMSKEARIRWSKLIKRFCRHVCIYYCCCWWHSLCVCLCADSKHPLSGRNSHMGSKPGSGDGTDDDVLVFYGEDCDVDESVYDVNAQLSRSQTNSSANSPGFISAQNSSNNVFRSNSKAYNSNFAYVLGMGGGGGASTDDSNSSLTAGLLADVICSSEHQEHTDISMKHTQNADTVMASILAANTQGLPAGGAAATTSTTSPFNSYKSPVPITNQHSHVSHVSHSSGGDNSDNSKHSIIIAASLSNSSLDNSLETLHNKYGNTIHASTQQGQGNNNNSSASSAHSHSHGHGHGHGQQHVHGSSQGKTASSTYFSAFMTLANPPKLNAVGNDSPLYPVRNSTWVPTSNSMHTINTSVLPNNPSSSTGGGGGGGSGVGGTNSQQTSPRSNNSNSPRGSSSDSSYRVGHSFNSNSNNSAGSFGNNTNAYPGYNNRFATPHASGGHQGQQQPARQHGTVQQQQQQQQQRQQQQQETVNIAGNHTTRNSGSSRRQV
jgi:hypothetical protein